MTLTVPRPTRYVEQIMGLPISLALRGRHATDGLGRKAWASVVAQLQDVDRVFSTYREDSVISRLDRDEISPADCPSEVREVLAIGEQAAQQSGGAFRLRRPGPDGRLRLDPNGVVKGWALERAAVMLADLNDTDFCLSGGGDLTCRVLDPDAPAWRIGIEDPHDTQRMLAVMPLRGGAMATSGTAHRGAHLVDGRTGLVPTGVSQVTVITGSLTWADIDATAAYAHGAAAADWLGRRAGRTGLVVWPDGSTTTVAPSGAHTER